jgi:hypothetical protein
LKKLHNNSQRDEGADEDVVKKLMELRTYLEKHIKELEDETEKLKALFKIVDEVIITKSFKTAGMIPMKKPQPMFEKKEVTPLNTGTGVLLANMYVDELQLQIIPVEGLVFSNDTSPFQTFFINRILEPMKKKDSEAMRKGEVMSNEILSYDVVTDGDIIREIIIKNYGNERRLREIKTSSRWTFEKMYEKTHS